MQTLYGMKITDRVTVKENPPGSFTPYFDGKEVGAGPYVSGKRAVNEAINWLGERRTAMDREIEQRVKQEEQNQEEADNGFLKMLAFRLGIAPEDLDTLIDIAKRRS